MAAKRPSVLVFDVNETLSDLSALRPRLEQVGAPAELMATWFAGVLRDGFALTAAGAYAPFSDVALDGLRALLPRVPGWTGDVEAAARRILDGFAHLNVHADVPDGVRELSAAGTPRAPRAPAPPPGASPSVRCRRRRHGRRRCGLGLGRAWRGRVAAHC